MRQCYMMTAAIAALLASAYVSQGAHAAPLVTAAVNDSATVAVPGERSAMLAVAVDQGALPDSRVLSHVRIELKRPAASQAALDQLVHDQQVPTSRYYHQWLKPADLRAYGPDAKDVAKVTSWLQSHGLTVNGVSSSGMSIDVAGKASDFGTAFHTSLHTVSVRGEAHIANMTGIAIPAALAPVLRGATLSNFFPKPNLTPVNPKFTVVDGKTTFYAVGPADFAKIYNVNPLYTGTNGDGIVVTGKGVTVAVVEQTDINPADWNTFRTFFGVKSTTGSLTITHPGNCGDPGFTPGDETEAAIDAEWAGAVAPDASIIEAACPGSSTTFGVETTLQNLVELGTTASALSISYGGSEVSNGLTFIDGFTNLVEEGASEGLSISISAGDSGSSSSEDVTSTGLAVNGLSTNPYNTTIGGTDFYDTALGENSKYWTKTNTSGLEESAKSYIPEIPWDNACSNTVITKYLGYKTPMISCNSTPVGFTEQQGVGGSGGQSLYYEKPDFQSLGIPGMPNDGVRDQPDISLFAANGIWGHFYIECMSNTAFGGVPCNFNNVNDVLGSAYGGTSFGAPIFAGLTALIVEAEGHKLGNVAPSLYQIAQEQFTNPLLAQRCDSTLGNAISTACVFNDVEVGDNTEPCVAGTLNCHTTAASTMGIGILSAESKAPFTNAFPAQQGYSLATGLGTVNMTNLLLTLVDP